MLSSRATCDLSPPAFPAPRLSNSASPLAVCSSLSLSVFSQSSPSRSFRCCFAARFCCTVGVPSHRGRFASALQSCSQEHHPCAPLSAVDSLLLHEDLDICHPAFPCRKCGFHRSSSLPLAPRANLCLAQLLLPPVGSGGGNAILFLSCTFRSLLSVFLELLCAYPLNLWPIVSLQPRLRNLVGPLAMFLYAASVKQTGCHSSRPHPLVALGIFHVSFRRARRCCFLLADCCGKSLTVRYRPSLLVRSPFAPLAIIACIETKNNKTTKTTTTKKKNQKRIEKMNITGLSK
ncbi:uncharacterized protein BJ171DRAFT_275777 [Polychytrium aggregatum]|uniref:uncharacterized protein n=1 Tax=Polychytrium aggregatum TaxID=110093 RepID=UPI0022FDBF1D|nr:uncharacterized protein BJ171DRAFT_275777 [Polychytrium aggregatum]KAI9207447.1 hypothetical protein BJ171DRAFT_275777 [Polychytrium aggregatum]